MGWIKVDRKLLENEMWLRKPFSWGQAWVDLLLLANHEDHTALIGHEIVECKRGQVNRSQQWLANRWGWSRAQVRHFLTTIKTNNSATITTDNKKTVITIENWGKYQGEQPTKKPKSVQLNNHSAATYKKNKEIKKVVVDARAREEKPEKAESGINVNNESNASAARLSTPPTLNDLTTFCSQENLQVDCVRFARYYGDRGWKTSTGRPITNWQQKLRDWDASDKAEREEEQRRKEAAERGRREQAEREARLEAEYQAEFEEKKKRLFKLV